MPSVQWMKMGPTRVYEPVTRNELAGDGLEIASENEGSVIYRINGVDMGDAGSYMCRAENAVGFHEKELRVDGKFLKNIQWLHLRFSRMICIRDKKNMVA